MANGKKGGLGGIIVLVLVLLLLKNIIPALAGLFGILLILAAIAFVALLVVVIVAGFKSGAGTENGAKTENAQGPTAEEKKALNEARSALSRIRVGCNRIKNVEIRSQFNEVCEKTAKILTRLKEEPSEIQTGRRVLNYYTSSVEKIQSKYITLQNSGEDLTETEEKLTANLDEIKAALDKLYSKLFENDKLDLTVEMKALSIALKRDGLIDEAIPPEFPGENPPVIAEENIEE